MERSVPNSIAAFMLLATLVIPVHLAAHHTRYKLIDLGTLGGPSAYQSVNGPQDQIINDAGMVGFTADTDLPDPNAPFCFEPDCFVSHSTNWQNGLLTDLGALPGNGNGSASAAINALGWITGQSENGEIDPFSGVPEVRSVLWQSGAMIDLGTFGGSWSLPLSLNNAGEVVGFASNTISYPSLVFPPSGTEIRAYAWRKGALTDLGTLGGPEAQALSINQSGQIVGMSFTSSTPNGTTGIPPLHAVLWNRDQMIDLGTLGGTYSGGGSCAFASPFCNGPGEEGSLLVNNRGQVIGTSNLAGDQIFHPFLWQHGKMQDLGTLGGDNGTALWLTDKGNVVGQADVPKSPPGCVGPLCVHHAFVWRSGVITDLGTIGNDACSRALMNNARGQIVGVSIHVCGSNMDEINHAFLWEDDGAMVDLNTLIPADSGSYLYEANKINSRGQIIASGLPAGCGDRNACGHLYLLVPCGEGTEGCVGAAESTTVATQIHSTASSITLAQPQSTARRARWTQRYHIPGIGTHTDY